MIKLKKTWRWFGPGDAVKLNWLKQMGVEGVVTALHHIPAGEVWPEEEILKRKEQIEQEDLTWEVVESLPVTEEIKQGSETRSVSIRNYQESLRNLARHGIKTVVYNFMPVIDWIRTTLHHSLPGGSTTLFFDWSVFAAFDIHILQRPEAEKEYASEIVQGAEKIAGYWTPEDKDHLANTIIVVTQGFINGPKYADTDYKKEFLSQIDKYRFIDKEKLRENLAFFLGEILPVAEKWGINLAIHPDDPPFPVLGLPRIFSTIEDMKWLVEGNASLNNGMAFCAGSLSAREENDLIRMVKEYGERIHFVHLRNTEVLGDGSFYESGLLKGRINMAALTKVLLEEMQHRQDTGRKDIRIPVRPDHGIKLFDDFHLPSYPGYPLIGRLKGLAEICGLEEGILRGQ
jgi:mannonate dehydratase